MSLVASCETQAEVDTLWEKLCAGGQPGACGWLTDRFGVSWQVVPRPMLELINASDGERAQRAFDALMKMTKLDLAAMKRAYDGG